MLQLSNEFLLLSQETVQELPPALASVGLQESVQETVQELPPAPANFEAQETVQELPPAPAHASFGVQETEQEDIKVWSISKTNICI